MSGKFIKHKKFLDVCVKVTKWHPYGDDIQVEGEFYNMGYVQSWPLGMTKKFKINASKLNEWDVLASGTEECLRHGKWVSL